MRHRGGTRTLNAKVFGKVLSRMPGFRARGSFYIGTCNRDVVAGYALDAPPGGVDVLRFVLPSFDKIEFLHLALARSVGSSPIHAQRSPAEFAELVASDWREFSGMRDCQSLLAYLDEQQLTGHYAQWTRFLSFAKIGDFSSAEMLEAQLRSSVSQLSQAVSRNLSMVLDAKQRAGWMGVQSLLADWSENSLARFGA